MDKKKIILISILLVLILILGIVLYLIFRNKNCEKYSYNECPVGCIVSSSRPETEDIGCFSSDHEKDWPRY